MHVCATSGTSSCDELVRGERQPQERSLRNHLATTDARAHGDVHYDDTSDSQLIARWRSRARSPMSMPVVVAT